MSFSNEWEQRYAENTHLSVWPWSDVVSLTRRHCRDLGAQSRVLELGCGAGANIPFFEALGVAYSAIEGSPTIAAKLRERLPHLAQNIITGDFTQPWELAPGFDLVIDRASLTCNGGEAIRRCLRQVHEALLPGGFFIGVDWYSTLHSDYANGERGEDKFTRNAFTSGSFANTGNVHFSDQAHLRDLFADFDLLMLEEKQAVRYQPADNHRFASWLLVARKPLG